MRDRTLHSDRLGPGPYTVDQVCKDDRCELSDGRPVYAVPASSDVTQRVLTGAMLLDSDPRLTTTGLRVGVDVGCALNERTLRAPDIAVADFADAPGWYKGAPILAVEYISLGQDEAELQRKIQDLLAAGTHFVWVARLLGIRRMEIYEPEKPMRVAHVREELVAPGVLQNPIPVEAMFDRRLAEELTLRNFLQRRGYQDLDAVREEGRERGREERRQALRSALKSILLARDFSLSQDQADRLAACRDTAVLQRWLGRAVTARAAAEVFE